MQHVLSLFSSLPQPRGAGFTRLPGVGREFGVRAGVGTVAVDAEM